MRTVSLASGSGGNAYAVESHGELLLIDCGICHRELKKRMDAVGLGLDDACGVLVTHEHYDHVKGLGVLHKHLPDLPLYANLMTAEAVEAVCPSLAGAFSVFENGMEFRAGPFAVAAFSIPHDVCDPVGYVVKADGATYFHATDVGAPLDSVGVKLALADCATLESNHDVPLLNASGRPEALKARIRGPRGHLCNEDAAALVRRFASPRLRHLALAHLSAECNEPALAARTMRETLDAMGMSDVALEVLSQDEPGEIWEA